MSGIPETFDEREDARADCAAALRRARRNGYPVATLEIGREWEIQEPDDCMMVPDECGVLRLSHTTYGCQECGCRHETREDAGQCCNSFDDEIERTDADDDD